MKSESSLKNVVAVVTGGASGLGEATARLLASRGALPVILDRDASKAAATATDIGPAASFVQADITDASSVEAAINHATQRGELRIVVGCAGVGWASRTLSKENVPHDLALFNTVIQINLVGTFNVLRVAAAAMAKNSPDANGERGVIINTASVAAYDGQVGQVAYAASKGGVVAMTLPAARDLAPLAIRVMTIAPGTFDTPMMAMLPDAAKQALAAAIPYPKRLGLPSEYAQLAVHIAENPYLNGETIRLDGALRMAPK